jgi:UDP-N-acetylglucosamine 2-epimerase (non-hydrolysing)
MLLIAYGTRPEWLKIKPIIQELKYNKIPFLTLFTGQHKDIIENDVIPDLKIAINESYTMDRLNKVATDVMRATALILHESPDIKYVMVQGDTSSALAVALAAYNANRPVVHLEAGLRTYDLENPYPEEANRQLISRIADVNLCPTMQNLHNLENEHVSGSKYQVGNTALDNLLPYVAKCDYENKILVTLHRRENHEMIKDWFGVINRIAGKYSDHEFILPIHPNPNVKIHADILTNVKVVNPLSHDDLLNILVKCKFVITDSGGIQEECSFLGKKAIVCRKETERPEAIGYTTELCESPTELMSMVSEMMERYEVIDNHLCPFGDGHSAKKIVKILKALNLEQYR